jgi:hypothetical protein
MNQISNTASGGSGGSGGSNAAGIMGGISSIGNTLNNTWDQYYGLLKDFGVIPDRQKNAQKLQERGLNLQNILAQQQVDRGAQEMSDQKKFRNLMLGYK